MKIKLLLADDEPLVLVGLQSMIDWNAYNIELCSVAHNGEEALKRIAEQKPDIVLIDIKMPVKDGLEVVRECRKAGSELPLFILLTSFEEFQFAKKAIRLGAVDYLIKLELTPESLADAVKRCLKLLATIYTRRQGTSPAGTMDDLSILYERFFIRLYNGLFENRQQYELQRKELQVDFSFNAYTVCYCEILDSASLSSQNCKQRTQLYSGTVHMIRETINRYMACYITSLDLRHFNITFCLSQQELPDVQHLLQTILQEASDTVYSYFNVTLTCRIGRLVKDPYAISESYASARHVLSTAHIAFFDPQTESTPPSLDIPFYRKEIAQAFEQLDMDVLSQALSKIAAALKAQPSHYIEALDIASTLLYMSITLLPDGETLLNRIFTGEDSYRCLYRCQTVVQVVEWITILQSGLVCELTERRQTYKAHTVQKVMQYIRANLNRKLSLPEVAAFFGFSPNYLSQLFAKETGQNFVEFITHEKIAAAKEMMANSDCKIYEIAEKLGFDSAFYFSKVFKKVEGCSPREYMRRSIDRI